VRKQGFSESHKRKEYRKAKGSMSRTDHDPSRKGYHGGRNHPGPHRSTRKSNNGENSSDEGASDLRKVLHDPVVFAISRSWKALEDHKKTRKKNHRLDKFLGGKEKKPLTLKLQ